jgi:spermidine synthase
LNVHIEERPDSGLALYIDGDLQFDSSDEALYHEGLALPPLVLARAADPVRGLRVLICGGGDGLALRECLRYPGVGSVDLVDYSPEVVDLGRTAFAALNDRAFEDARVCVHLTDAWEFLRNAGEGAYDVILCDFTVPRRAEDGRVFTREWYARVGHALTSGGVAALNAASPQVTPEAFWCLRRTVRAAGLNALPFRVCIPSFRDQGYGAWGFLLAAKRRIRRADFRAMASCPVPTRALDLDRLWDAADFPMEERRREAFVPVHTLERPCLLPLLMNPGAGVRDAAAAAGDAPPSLDALLRTIPILHPYHTRVMVESMAEQVVGSVRALDLRRLIDALLEQGRDLTDDLRHELKRLRSFLDLGSLPRMEVWGDWARRLFVCLVLLITLANIVAPDNVFGKGSFGLGHSSVSRGYSSVGFGRSGGSFGGSASGFRATSRGGSSTGSGSFGRQGTFGGSGFRPTSAAPTAPLTGSGFRGGWQRGQATDIFGNSYSPRVFRYRVAPAGGGYYGGYSGVYISSYSTGPHYYGSHGSSVGDGGGSGGAMPAAQEQAARFVADDDMLVLNNGDVVITLSDAAYLLVSGGRVHLYGQNSPDPVMALFADPRLLANISARLKDQRKAAKKEIGLRRDWLSWVGWTSALFPVVRADKDEVKGLQDLTRRLDAAAKQVGEPSADAKLPPDLPEAQAAGAVELFSGGGLLADGRVALVDDGGTYWFTDGKTMTRADGGKPQPCPPALVAIIRSVLPKMEKEMSADLVSLGKDMTTLASDKASLDTDLREYTSLYNSNGPSYEVDYGTDEISAQEALDRTKRDLAQNLEDTRLTIAEQAKTQANIERVRAAQGTFGK